MSFTYKHSDNQNYLVTKCDISLKDKIFSVKIALFDVNLL
jgi:hypothetical protein